MTHALLLPPFISICSPSSSLPLFFFVCFSHHFTHSPPQTSLPPRPRLSLYPPYRVPSHFFVPFSLLPFSSTDPLWSFQPPIFSQCHLSPLLTPLFPPRAIYVCRKPGKSLSLAYRPNSRERERQSGIENSVTRWRRDVPQITRKTNATASETKCGSNGEIRRHAGAWRACCATQIRETNENHACKTMNIRMHDKKTRFPALLISKKTSTTRAPPPWKLHIAKVGSIPSPYLGNVVEQK